MLINRVKIFSTIQSKTTNSKPILNSDPISYENLGNKLASICCVLNCTSPLSESKDYKTLAKVFKKLMMNIENIYVVNINGSNSTNFIHFIHEFNFNKIFIFGEDALMNNLPIQLKKLIPSTFEMHQILLIENLNTLTESTDVNLKAQCWDAISNFYKS
jgi:Icc-related predicted phosphoesterase